MLESPSAGPLGGARRGRPRPAPRRRGRGAYDKFRERVIFPIRDATGHAVGPRRPHPARHGGRGRRPAATDGPKYLNSPATALFDKSRTLYLIDRAKSAIRKTGQAVIVEGYTDALMAHQAGFENVVASLGTALTPAQVAVIDPLRHARSSWPTTSTRPASTPAPSAATELYELIGELAAEETGVELDRRRASSGCPRARTPTRSSATTPDLWREAVRTAQPIVDYLIDYYATAFDVRTAGGQAHAVGARACRSSARSATRSCATRYLQTLARRTGVEERVLLEALAPAPAEPAGRPRRRRSSGDDHAGARITADAVTRPPDDRRPESRA